MEKGKVIYHIVTLNDLKAQTVGGLYRPGNFDKDGFIHCTAEPETALLVLEDYFVKIAESSDIFILEVDITKVISEIRYEPPAPIQGAGTRHKRDGILFPHIYGSLNIDAVNGAGKVKRVEGKFQWPSVFEDIKIYL